MRSAERRKVTVHEMMCIRSFVGVSSLQAGKPKKTVYFLDLLAARKSTQTLTSFLDRNTNTTF